MQELGDMVLLSCGSGGCLKCLPAEEPEHICHGYSIPVNFVGVFYTIANCLYSWRIHCYAETQVIELCVRQSRITYPGKERKTQQESRPP